MIIIIQSAPKRQQQHIAADRRTASSGKSCDGDNIADCVSDNRFLFVSRYNTNTGTRLHIFDTLFIASVHVVGCAVPHALHIMLQILCGLCMLLICVLQYIVLRFDGSCFENACSVRIKNYVILSMLDYVVFRKFSDTQS